MGAATLLLKSILAASAGLPGAAMSSSRYARRAGKRARNCMAFLSRIFARIVTAISLKKNEKTGVFADFAGNHIQIVAADI
jgi:hypothetical protein